jgi:hypothetical protein
MRFIGLSCVLRWGHFFGSLLFNRRSAVSLFDFFIIRLLLNFTVNSIYCQILLIRWVRGIAR